jgi:cell pole-organizing protein PopZ
MARTEPRVLPWPADDGKAAPAPEKDKAAPAPAAAKPQSLPLPPSPELAAPVVAPSESLASLLSESAIPAGPVFGLAVPVPVVSAEPMLAPPAGPEPESASPAVSAATGTGLALPTRALEQVVAELLEPVIQQWLQSNLPHLIEKVVREEAAKAVAAARDPTKA